MLTCLKKICALGVSISVNLNGIFTLLTLFLIATCAPGNFSSDGFTPCQSCPLGTYQPHSGRVVCYPCPGGGKFGGKAGAVSISECPSMSSLFFSCILAIKVKPWNLANFFLFAIYFFQGIFNV